MDIEQIKQLMVEMETHGVRKIEWNEQDVFLKLERSVPLVQKTEEDQSSLNSTDFNQQLLTMLLLNQMKQIQSVGSLDLQALQQIQLNANDTQLFTKENQLTKPLNLQEETKANPTTEVTEKQEEPLGEPVTSPVLGVFYAAANPEAEPYVKVGQIVHKGDVLCIIEAMKLMNEVVSEKNGKITAILANNGDRIEYGQPLFLMEEV